MCKKSVVTNFLQLLCNRESFFLKIDRLNMESSCFWTFLIAFELKTRNTLSEGKLLGTLSPDSLNDLLHFYE